MVASQADLGKWPVRFKLFFFDRPLDPQDVGDFIVNPANDERVAWTVPGSSGASTRSRITCTWESVMRRDLKGPRAK